AEAKFRVGAHGERKSFAALRASPPLRLHPLEANPLPLVGVTARVGTELGIGTSSGRGGAVSATAHGFRDGYGKRGRDAYGQRLAGRPLYLPKGTLFDDGFGSSLMACSLGRAAARARRQRGAAASRVSPRGPR